MNHGQARFDASFFESLARMIDEEPALPRDAAILQRMKRLGIGKGKAFQPDEAIRDLLAAAARQAHDHFVKRGPSWGTPFWADGRWRVANPVGPETAFTFERDGVLDVEERGFIYYLACAPPARLGEASFYASSWIDASGQPLSGENSYRLRVPPRVPAKQFWAATVHDAESAAFIRESPRVEANSYEPLRRNDDGSVDLTFGPSAPAGEESNWIPTVQRRQWFAFFRLYGIERIS